MEFGPIDDAATSRGAEAHEKKN